MRAKDSLPAEARSDAMPQHLEDNNLIVVHIRDDHYVSLYGEEVRTIESSFGFSVRTEVIEPLGSDTLVFFSIGAVEVIARLPPSTSAAPGNEIRLCIESEKIHLFDPVSERSL